MLVTKLANLHVWRMLESAEAAPTEIVVNQAFFQNCIYCLTVLTGRKEKKKKIPDQLLDSMKQFKGYFTEENPMPTISRSYKNAIFNELAKQCETETLNHLQNVYIRLKPHLEHDCGMEKQRAAALASHIIYPNE